MLGSLGGQVVGEDRVVRVVRVVGAGWSSVQEGRGCQGGQVAGMFRPQGGRGSQGSQLVRMVRVDEVVRMVRTTDGQRSGKIELEFWNRIRNKVSSLGISWIPLEGLNSLHTSGSQKRKSCRPGGKVRRKGRYRLKMGLMKGTRSYQTGLWWHEHHW